MATSKKIEGFVDRVLAIGDKATAMSQLSGWMMRNLRLNGRKYTFKDHEMQEQIASDQHPSKVVKKCSQIGLTELSLRLTAAIAAVTRSRIIYVFPSAKFAEKVSADRFLPIITGSPMLMGMQHAEVKSAGMRKLGNSTVYFQGASGTTQAISIPATHLMIDEEDFCDPVILGQFNARLRHADEDPETGLRGVRQRFSTPTIPGYGVSLRYDGSDQKQYMVQCSKCNTWQAPDYYTDFVVPGYEDALEKFDKYDLENPKYKVSEAYVKCEKCGNDLWKDLLNPVKRQWVAKYPDRRLLSGYTISPIDVPVYNKIPAIIRQLDDYTIQDHRNFVLGKEHEDKHNSFLMSVFENRTDAYYTPPFEAKNSELSGLRFGIDIGKTAHLIVGKAVSRKIIHVIYMVQLSINDGLLAEQIQKLIDAFRPEIVVLDSGPDFSTPQALIEDNRWGQVFGCEYGRSVKGAYTHLDPLPEDGLVKADRSGTLSDTMEAHNNGNIHYPRNCEEVEILKEHLKVTKKLEKPSEMGKIVAFPKPVDPDHYAHALNYLCIANTIAGDHDILNPVLGVLPGVSAVAIGSNLKKDAEVNPRNPATWGKMRF